ncbi:hypothetical protein FRAAL0758 [Frankia alni ACN14a]|uniref:Uncharacterized protein n=1 Tax=Frankia alni (strain DSM 45986 / CECT 9034 / ACN14a) TaxID=326424 RepID=Q0RAM8_FRAAA|nr:hypothetical protein FRAAL0758 [Frankia alni ACN14a]
MERCRCPAGVTVGYAPAAADRGLPAFGAPLGGVPVLLISELVTTVPPSRAPRSDALPAHVGMRDVADDIRPGYLHWEQSAPDSVRSVTGVGGSGPAGDTR